MFSNIVIGNIIHAEIVKSQYGDNKEFLSITLAVEDRTKTSIRIKFNNSNGLLTAFKSATLVTGMELIIYQFDVKLDSIKSKDSQYTRQDGSTGEYKYTQMTLTNVSAKINWASAPDRIKARKRLDDSENVASKAPEMVGTAVF